MFCAYCTVCGSVLSRRIISSMPRTALMGVRISCDMLDRNADFASFAASAFAAMLLSSDVVACRKRISLSSNGTICSAVK